MVDADITTDLKGLVEAIDKADLPQQLFGYLSTLAGPGATMVPSRQLIPELKKLLDAEMKKHRARIASSGTVGNGTDCRPKTCATGSVARAIRVASDGMPS